MRRGLVQAGKAWYQGSYELSPPPFVSPDADGFFFKCPPAARA